ncbi:MAG: hypothetical protein ACLRWP_10310 [Bilophila wadsworthia]
MLTGAANHRAVGTRRIRLAEARTRPTGAAFSGTVLRLFPERPCPAWLFRWTFLIGDCPAGCGRFSAGPGGNAGPPRKSPRCFYV